MAQQVHTVIITEHKCNINQSQTPIKNTAITVTNDN